ncbi:MAG TPA: ArsA-related P-loop ATPase [Bacteriovoracaceae bacterium]|nr:ArsA-related P-loop ATPase [Bacteriovoracaceae bacterium]
MNAQPCRLYIFTGKGGVGKTTLSKAFVRHLNEQGHEAIYLTFRGNAMGESNPGTSEIQHKGIKEVALDLEECARGYMERRLSSKMIASWIVKTPFFRALMNMVPGFNYLIFLGKILEMGKADNNLIVVLDAPASGHALTMVESTTNFQQIFESGVIFEDAGKMLSRLNDKAYTKIHVVSLPSLMSWQEAIELKSGLATRTPVDVHITVNNCLYPLVADQMNDLPTGLREKASNEKQLIDENQSQMHCILPHSLSSDPTSIELDLVGSLSKLI